MKYKSRARKSASVVCVPSVCVMVTPANSGMVYKLQPMSNTAEGAISLCCAMSESVSHTKSTMKFTHTLENNG